MWEIERYRPDLESEWNRLVKESRNGTFLFERAYMDYHADRFEDCSWMALKNGRPKLLLPANITEDHILQSHGGLTYGGWILPVGHIDGADLLDAFTLACAVWKSEGFKAIDYKTVPYIYWQRPSAEDEYALFRLGGKLTESNLSSAIDLTVEIKYNKLQKRHLAKSKQRDISIIETDDVDGFMQMLTVCLNERHDVDPVHMASEMQMLKSRFPDKIRFHVVIYEGEMQAGVCIYDTGVTAHCQYIATTAVGRELNLLTPLFDNLIRQEYASKRYFDFGTSNENHGQYLNAGLLRQKFSYGATGVVYNRYILEF